MRLKYYLRGLGLGIIFTVIIMTIGSHTSKAKTDPAATESLSKANTELSTEYHKSTKQIKDTQADTSKADDSQADDISTSEITNDITTDEITGSEASSDTSDTPDASAQPEVKTTFTINVSGSDTCRMIAERLQAAGIVDDSEKFRIYMGQKGADHLIADGDHEIPYGASYDDIINILTQK
ncbi:hypothetical protein [Agathobacter sp.]